jgi:hypothetical protein
MGIIKHTSTTELISKDGTQVKREETWNGVIIFTFPDSTAKFYIRDGVWREWDSSTSDWKVLTGNIPTWEEEYQEALLAQYPFEKRVREVVENNVGVGEVIFDLARDFDFNQLLKSHLEKQPIQP